MNEAIVINLFNVSKYYSHCSVALANSAEEFFMILTLNSRASYIYPSMASLFRYCFCESGSLTHNFNFLRK